MKAQQIELTLMRSAVMEEDGKATNGAGISHQASFLFGVL